MTFRSPDFNPAFTFQYIYIKTIRPSKEFYQLCLLHSSIFILKHLYKQEESIQDSILHSSIFILKPDGKWYERHYSFVFTFQYIYIKTDEGNPFKIVYIILHSSIFILKPKGFLSFYKTNDFTFQYIYIKTLKIHVILNFPVIFTFQYIYIKTLLIHQQYDP